MSDLKRMAGGDPAINQNDPLLQLRAEALLVCGYDPHHKGEIEIAPSNRDVFEATLGRCLLRYLNQRARAN